MLSAILQSTIDGLLIGGVYTTIGLGLSLAYGVMYIINWSAGETLMLGLYLAWALVSFMGFDPYLTIPITMLVIGLFGYILQSGVFNRMIEKGGKNSRINILLFTSGLGMAVTAIMEILLGSQPVTAKTIYTGKSIIINDLFISVPKLISFGIAIFTTIALYIFVQRTETGRAIRATTQDRVTAQLMGINANKVYCIAFALSLAAVGLSASLLVPYYPIRPNVGATFSFKALIVVVLGGRGNIMGALVGGLLVGVIEKLGAFLWSDAYSQGLVFLMFITILLVQPDGLLSIRFKRKKQLQSGEAE